MSKPLADKRGVPLLAVCLALLLAGCAAPTAAPAESDVGETNPSDGLGTVDGVAHDEELDVNTTDGLDESELNAVAARTMARIQIVRGLEYEETVPIEVISREEFRSHRAGTHRQRRGDPYGEWNNQVWKALFIVDEDTDVTDEFDEVYGASVAGYYTSADGGKIVLVSDDADVPTVNRHTLVHELVHALQDQHFGLGPNGETQDERRAVAGIIEGEAEYVTHRYAQRCGAEWDCIEQIERPPADRPREFNLPLFLVLYQPYSDGPAFVRHLHEDGDWTAVDTALAERRPVSSTQIIHPERYPDEEPRRVSVEDRSGAEWERFDDLPGGRAPSETVGEASLYAAFYAQGTIDDGDLRNGDDELSPFNYSHPITNGWDGDAVVPYRNDGEYGYVFQTAWRTEADATMFREAYERMLDRRATERDGSAYVVPEDESFSGAYRVEQDGDVVTVVHAPAVEELDEIHASDGRSSLAATIPEPVVTASPGPAAVTRSEPAVATRPKPAVTAA